MIRTDTELDQEPVIAFAKSERPQFYRVGDLGPFPENGRDLAGGKKLRRTPNAFGISRHYSHNGSCCDDPDLRCKKPPSSDPDLRVGGTGSADSGVTELESAKAKLRYLRGSSRRESSSAWPRQLKSGKSPHGIHAAMSGWQDTARQLIGWESCR